MVRRRLGREQRPVDLEAVEVWQGYLRSQDLLKHIYLPSTDTIVERMISQVQQEALKKLEVMSSKIRIHVMFVSRRCLGQLQI